MTRWEKRLASRVKQAEGKEFDKLMDFYDREALAAVRNLAIVEGRDPDCVLCLDAAIYNMLSTWHATRKRDKWRKSDKCSAPGHQKPRRKIS